MNLETDKMIAEIEDNIGWVIFNNPAKRNAVSLAMWKALGQILSHYQENPQVRVVIMKGAGDKAFVAGADISEFEDKRADADAEKEYNRQSALAHQALYSINKPLLAMVQGFCIGGGMAVALSADLRFATPDSKFGIPAARLGLGYGFGGMKALSDLVGPSHAKDILMSARFLDADEAFRIGLINRIFEREDIEAEVRAYAETMAANAPLTVAAVKAGIREASKDPDKRDLDSLNRMIKQCFDSQDYKEGRRAFMEKRKPDFTGK